MKANQAVVSITMTAQSEEKQFAYFLNLEIENILCFKDKQTLNLSNEKNSPAQWTVILGDNGVGKTTLLRCIAGMSLYEKEITTQVTQQKVKKEINVTMTFKDIYNTVVWDCYAFRPLEGEINTIYAEYYIGESLKAASRDNKAFKDTEQSKPTYLDLWSLLTYDCFLPERVLDSRCFGYSATRITNPVSLGENPITHPFANLFSDKAFLVNAEEWLLQTDYAQKSSKGERKKKLTKKLNDIKKVFRNALPDVDDFDFDFGDRWDTEAYVKFKTLDGWVRFEDLGLGYKTMIIWLLDLIIRLYERYPDSDDPLSEPAIVLVDEIDLHLHPKWQRQIMSFLTERFPNTQFIVTAHSPLVVQAAKDANIVLLRREGDRVIIDNDPQIVDNWRVDQVLTSIFDIPSARPPQLDDKLKRREEILSKSHLTDADKAELQQLREDIGAMPTGENTNDIHAMDIIRQAAKLLEEK